MEIKTVLDLFQVIPAIFNLEVNFPLAMLLFNLLFYYVVSIIVLFICILNFFYDGKINTYICNNFSPSFWYKKYLAYIGTPANTENNCTKLPGFEFTKLGSYTREIMRNITCQ